MAKTTFKAGDKVRVLDGKHANETGVVEHSDRSITTVKFQNGSDPVWTSSLCLES